MVVVEEKEKEEEETEEEEHVLQLAAKPFLKCLERRNHSYRRFAWKIQNFTLYFI